MGGIIKYRSILNFKDTQVAIKQVKDYFQKELAEALNLMRVTAPLMVVPESGLNDCLNGTERPVQFDLLETGADVQIVQSLAKWKRFALGKIWLCARGGPLYGYECDSARRDYGCTPFYLCGSVGLGACNPEGGANP